MTEKELKKLNRYELLEMLIAQSKKVSRLEKELEEARAELERREIAIDSSGSMAEAALKLNGIFEDADRAAQQYMDSVKTSAKKLMEEAVKMANQTVSQTREKS